MRWLLLAAFVGLAPRDAEACSILIDPFVPGRRVETNPPGDGTIGKVTVVRSEDTPPESSCSAVTGIRIEVAATDDTTPSGALGFRLRVVTGTPRLATIDELDYDRRAGTLGLNASGNDQDLDFELGISAIDASGNVGPEATVHIVDEAPGCNSGGSWSLLSGLAVLGLTRRRRFSPPR